MMPTPFAEQLLDLALRSGAEAAEVFVERSRHQPVLFESNALKQLESRDSEGTALRLWVEGRPGMAVAYGTLPPEKLVETAIALSRLNEPEAIELTNIPPKNCRSQYGETVDVPQLMQWGEAVIDQLLDEYEDLQCVLELEQESTTTQLFNSQGLACDHTNQILSIYGAAEWVRGEDLLCIEAEQTQRDTLDISRYKLSLTERLQWSQADSASPVGRLPVLFTGKAAELLWLTVEAALNSKRVLEGASPWSDRLCQPILSPALTLFQDPNLGPFGRPFDDEGITTRRVEFIQQGVLQLFYTDRTLGRQLGCGSTGNGFRPGLERYPSPGLFNLMIAPGQHSFADLLALLDNGLIVDQFLGEVGSISGDFAINVDLGFRVEQGNILGRVKDTLVSGNVYEVLNQVIGLGNDADWYGSCYTPSILLEGLSVMA
ncbi:MAG: TldD/PmbA family protein [Thermosynechococcaceae cyanobacterium MS004]|nr:TldD/PmbA family protein [Thermosynechococcaceae cyanobacterium MS004]